MAKLINNKLSDILIGDEFEVGPRTLSTADSLSMISDEVEIGASYKLFAIKDFETLQPLCETKTVNQPLELAEDMKASSYVSEEIWSLTRLANTIQKANNGENIVVAALGGSITEGAGTSIKVNSYANRVFDWWENNYPGQVTRVNAGVGGTDSYLGVHRMPGQVLAENPDFIVVDFAVNDNGYEFNDYSYERIVRDLLNASDTTSVMMAFFLNVSSGVNSTNAQHKQIPIGEHYGVPMISVRDAVQTAKNAGKLEYSDVMADIVHPNDYGHWLASECITSVLDTVKNNLDEYAEGEYSVPENTVFSPLKYGDGKIYVHENNGGAKFGTVIEPVFNDGWTEGYTIDYVPSWSNNYGTGWRATEYGQTIRFTFEGKYVSLLYRQFKEDKSGIVKVTIDGDEDNPVYINSYSSDFVCLCADYAALPELEYGVHTIEIELVYPGDYDDSITRTGDFFGLCGIMVSE